MLIHYSKYLVLTLEKLACHVFGNKYVLSNIFIIFKYVVIKFDFIFWAPASQLCWIMYNLEKCNSNVLDYFLFHKSKGSKNVTKCASTACNLLQSRYILSPLISHDSALFNVKMQYTVFKLKTNYNENYKFINAYQCRSKWIEKNLQ